MNFILVPPPWGGQSGMQNAWALVRDELNRVMSLRTLALAQLAGAIQVV